MVEDLNTLHPWLNARFELLLAWMFTSGLRTIFILLIAYGLLRAIQPLMKKFDIMLQGFSLESGEQQKRAQTLSHIVDCGLASALLRPTVRRDPQTA
ncbi:MAG: hypothetical protein HYZ50_14340 [Deltaproteobacteria bacterium]|nr:hypothetical protein [Deltaproteobacteria bacterium]